ncbi:hypothetical protein [Piscirickettsia salmonis]|nr:hypothetical protein [Piscirickettsia salmonis]
MRQIMKIFVVLFTLILLSGCATTAKYRAQVERWKGHDVNDLIQAWGPPDTTFKMPNGNLYYSYRVNNINRLPSYYVPGNTTVSDRDGKTYITTSGGYQTGGGTIKSNCTTSFQVNKKDIIIGTHFQGNACVSN